MSIENGEGVMNHDYYQFCYEEEDSDYNIYQPIDNASSPPPLSPRNTLYPELSSLSSNLRKRAESFKAAQATQFNFGNNANILDDVHDGTETLQTNDYENFLIADNSYDLDNSFENNIIEIDNDAEYVNLTAFPLHRTSVDSSSIKSLSESSLTAEHHPKNHNENCDKTFKRKQNSNKISKSIDSLTSCSSSIKSKKMSLIEIFRRRSNTPDFEHFMKDLEDDRKKRSDSPLMFIMRRSKSLSSKSHHHNSESLNDAKKSLLSGYSDGSNVNTLEQPSPFVRTIFQFVESSFDDEIFPFEQFHTLPTDATPVFSTSDIKNFSDSKLFKSKTRHSFSSMERIVTQHAREPTLLTSGRRISENSDFFISVVAYLDRIRKAKSKQIKQRQSHSRQQRWKSDPGLTYVKLQKMMELYNELNSHSSDEKYHPNTIDKTQPITLSLNKRFELLSLSSNSSYDKPNEIHESFDKGYRSKSFTDFSSYHSNKKQSSILGLLKHKTSSRNSLNMSVKKKSLRKKQERINRESLSYEIKQLNDLNDDLNQLSEALQLKQHNSAVNTNSTDNLSKSHSANQCGFNHGHVINTLDDYLNKLDDKCDNIQNNYTTDHNKHKNMRPTSVDKLHQVTNIMLGSENQNTGFNNDLNSQSVYENISTFNNLDQVKVENNNIDNVVSTNTISSLQNIECEQDVEFKERLDSSPTNENNNKKIRTRVGSFGDKIKRNFNKNTTSDEIEYWVGEFKNSSSDSSTKEAKSKEAGIISNFKRQFGSMRKKDKKFSSENKNHEEMNVLRRVSSRSNEDVFHSPKKVVAKQRSSSFRLKREKASDKFDKNENNNVSSIRNVFEPIPAVSETKKKWKISSPKVKSAQKMFTSFVKREKYSPRTVPNNSSKVKSTSMKFIQYNSSPRLSPSCRVNNEKSLAYRKASYSPSLAKRSPQIELIRRHFESNADHSSSDYSSICSSNSNSTDANFSIETFHDFKHDSGNHSTESFDPNDISPRQCRQNIRKSLSLDYLMEIPHIESSVKYDNTGKCKSNEEVPKNNKDIVVDMGNNNNNSKEDIETIVVEVPSHLVPQKVSRVLSPYNNHKSNETKYLDENERSDSSDEGEVNHLVLTNTSEESVDKEGVNKNASIDDQEKDMLNENLENDTINDCLIENKPKQMEVDLSSEEAFIKQLLSENENEMMIDQLDIGHLTNKNLQLSLSHESIDTSLESLSSSQQSIVDFTNVPSIPQPYLLQQDVVAKVNVEDSSSSKHYMSFSMSASSIFDDLYSPKSKSGKATSTPLSQSPDILEKEAKTKATTPPPVKPKPKILKKISMTKPNYPPSNVAMVTPFIKNETEVGEPEDESTVRAFDGETRIRTVKRRRSPILNDEKPLTRKPSVIWALVKEMEVSLLIDCDYQDAAVIKIESFQVRRVNTYKDVAELAIDTFIKHLKLLDKQMLDLSEQDIDYLQMGMHKVPLDNETFDLSMVKIEDGFLPCHLCIEGKKSWSLAALAYDTLIPKEYLEKYFCLVISQQFVVFYGPSGTSKSYLAVRLANVVSYRVNTNKILPLIYRHITPATWKSLVDNIPDLIEKKESMVIVLDGFSQSFVNSGIDISDIVKLLSNSNPPIYVICTISQNPNYPVANEWQLNFRWIWLPNHEEPIDDILQRYLRRKFIHHGNPHLQKEYFRIADWLNSVWKHINKIIEKFHSVECTIGPTMFYSCPTDILSAEEWFVDLWNYSITPYFMQTIKQGIESRGQVHTWEDPLEWILQSYPWVSEKAQRKMKLRRIRLEDIGYRDKLNTESRVEQKRLMEFLHQLEMLMLDGGLGEIPDFTQLDYLESAL